MQGYPMLLSYNEKNKAYTCPTSYGFFVFKINPYEVVLKQDFKCSLLIAEVNNTMETYALVGSQRDHHQPFQSNVVMLWNDLKQTFIGELTYRSDVKSVKFTDEELIVSLDKSVYIYEYATLKMIQKIHRADPLYGNLVIAPFAEDLLCAVPENKNGTILITRKKGDPIKLSNTRKKASELMAMDIYGKYLACVINGGMDVVVYDIQRQVVLKELNRGKQRSYPQAIALNHDSTIVAYVSDTLTIHLFGMNIVSGYWRTIADFGYTKSNAKIVLDKETHVVMMHFTDNYNLWVCDSSSNMTHYRVSEENGILKVSEIEKISIERQVEDDN